MRKQFTEKFAEIQREFDKSFKQLFGGGHGSLELVEDEDILAVSYTHLDVYKRQHSRPGNRDSQRLQAVAWRGTVDCNGSTGTYVSTAWLYVRGAGRARDKAL